MKKTKKSRIKKSARKPVRKPSSKKLKNKSAGTGRHCPQSVPRALRAAGTAALQPEQRASGSSSVGRYAARPQVSKAMPKTNQTVILGKHEIKSLRNELVKLRDSLAKSVEDKRNIEVVEPDIGDSIDQASKSLDREMFFELSDNERVMLDDVEAALRKIDGGMYGACEQCRKPINKKRLKALPSARYCLVCQNTSENRRTA
ncbi:MAG: TraR/DksA C4-type zinc finger protein [Elusimicrobia bacterium]|nr:TraR/DksA C4-type zinc finger protein [Elusimicrobiota bacterium]